MRFERAGILRGASIVLLNLAAGAAVLLAVTATAGCFAPKVNCSDSAACPSGELCDIDARTCKPTAECADCSRPFDLSARQESDASNPSDEFGFTVAASGGVAVVSAFGDEANVGGSAYIYERQGTDWVVASKLNSPTPQPGNRFGAAVAVSIAGGDGVDVAVIGARTEDVVEVDAGSAHIYERTGGAWQSVLSVSGDANGDEVGCSVAVRGTVMAIGGCGDDTLLTSDGLVRAYERDEALWAESGVLSGTGVVGADRFGSAVAVGDGVIAVGAFGDDVKGDSAGAVYVFEKQDGVWAQQAKLLASDGAGGDLFGQSVAAHGSTIVVGAYRNDELGNNAGAAYVFEKQGGAWVETAKLLASDGVAVDLFGFSVSAAADQIAVGARWNDDTGEDSGSLYVFERRGARWLELGRFVDPEATAGYGLGYAIAIDQDALFATAYPELVDGNSGTFYVFDRVDN